MGENFQKIKKKTLLGAVIKSAVCGVSFGLFAAGATLLALKLAGVYLAFYYYLIIGVVGAALCGGLAFFLFRPDDKKLAKRLDNEYGLGEKVQTALAFANESGAVVEMQRLDTEARLASLPKNRFSVAKALSKTWQLILIGVLAVAIAVTAFLIPATYVQGGENTGDSGEQQDAPFQLTNEILDGLDGLIADVKASELEDNLKGSIATLLTRLEQNLFTAVWQSEVNALVGSTITNINVAVNNAYSYDAIASALNSYDLYLLASTVANAARVYRSFRFIEYSDLEIYAEDCGEEIYEQIEIGMDSFYEDIEEDAGTVPVLIITALTASKVSTTDKLYQLFYTLARGLASEAGPNKVQFALNLQDELAYQSYVRAARVYIFNVLGALFNYPVPEDPDFEVVDNRKTNGDDDDEDKDKDIDGGYGTGDWKNNAQVYDPRTGQYGNYMDILEDYYALIDEMLRGDTFTEEQQKIIEAYFQILFNGNTAGE